MKEELEKLLIKLSGQTLKQLDVIPWGTPVLSFGDIAAARMATIGLNPSEREFVDTTGKELDGPHRRFHTLRSLGLKKWTDVEEHHLTSIIQLYSEYFHRNPYDGWFKKLDHIISGTSNSYYFPSGLACHLDLIPFATFSKWTDLEPQQKTKLLDISIDTLGQLLKNSSIDVIVLNGKTVVDNFERYSDTKFTRRIKDEWILPRKVGGGVLGFAYEGSIRSLGNTDFDRTITVLGYNHNIQSSFGVTKEVQVSIRNWVSDSLIQKYHAGERHTIGEGIA